MPDTGYQALVISLPLYIRLSAGKIKNIFEIPMKKLIIKIHQNNYDKNF